VVVVVDDGPVPPELLARAAALAGAPSGRPERVAVVAIARMLGSSLGMPHPGLMPTAAERADRLHAVERTIAGLRRLGVPADGQVAVTRRAGRTVARIARTRQARAVLVARPQATGSRLRRLIEGDIARDVRRWCRRFPVEIVPATPGRPATLRPR
jgi:hypothetical protein